MMLNCRGEGEIANTEKNQIVMKEELSNLMEGNIRMKLNLAI